MSVIMWVMGLSLHMQGYLCSVEQTGCMDWKTHGDDVCCDKCHPGNRLVSECGRKASDLCTLCEPRTFTVKDKSTRCTRCTQCVDAQVQVNECTATTDTECGCKEGLACGNDVCSFCVTKCDKGQEPTEERVCRACPDGTFNDHSHQRCKPWSTRCPKPDQRILSKGDAFNDIECDNGRPDQLDPGEKKTGPLNLSLHTSVALIISSIINITVVVIVIRKINQKREKAKKTITKRQIIGTPTDDPNTSVAIECSFHEAEEEQDSSWESLQAFRPHRRPD